MTRQIALIHGQFSILNVIQYILLSKKSQDRQSYDLDRDFNNIDLNNQRK